MKDSLGRALYTNYVEPLLIKYGALYNGYVASKNGGIGNGSVAPIGWHVSTWDDLNDLKIITGNMASKLRDTQYWNDEEMYYPPTNTTGFSARGAGYRSGGVFGGFGTNAFFITPTGESFNMYYYTNAFNPISSYQHVGCSIRLVKDTSLWTEGETVTDFDGNIYNTVKIGDKVYAKENLSVTHYNDGAPISNVTDNTDWAELTTAGYCWYNNDINNGFITD